MANRNSWRIPLRLSGLAFALLAAPVAVADVPVPRVVSDDVELSLFASEPQIVTPVALAADARGRLFVAETHTHARDSSYDGPSDDRIYVYLDSNGDGDLDHRTVFADGMKNVLSMAFNNQGTLHVLEMKRLVSLHDRDGDGIHETKQTLLTIDTPNNNHHGVFLAVAADQQDRLYVTLGNIGGSPYTIRGLGGEEVTGQGDTGLIIRCAEDGSSLERFAHGFWNPCDLKFDTAGRLLATDNDPDARGPNRVLHIIRGGRYGYKSRFGNNGLHPYDSWNGELPGTLPMLAGVGEAPVGLLDCNQSSLPIDFVDNLPVGVWGTNEVIRIRTRREGGTITGQVELLIRGEANFRPTGIVATRDGTVYIGDWGDRQYPVHGKGRIWRLRYPSNPIPLPRNIESRLADGRWNLGSI